jgi:hypothetical protein
MWQHGLPSHVPTRGRREQFVIAPHHPDRLRRPAVSLGATSDERFRQALAWNIFRTLELVSPSFWLRRLHVRLTGEPSVVPPQIARVRLWHHLPLPPVQRIDGERPAVVADVVIETEHTVWTLVAPSESTELADSDQTAAMADASAWFAGARQHYCGVIESNSGPTSHGPRLQRRYSRSRDSARLQSGTRGPTAPTRVAWGSMQWSALAELLQDCCDAASLPPIERALGQNALDWLRSVGVHPLPATHVGAAISG